MQRIRKIKAFLIILSLVICLSACGDKKYVITTGFEKNELMRINGESTYLPEFMLYLTTIQNQYEAIYGDKLWNQKEEESSLEYKVKEMVLAKLAQIKVMNLMAKSYNLELSDDEIARINNVTDTFFDSLNDKEKEMLGITRDDVYVAYAEYAMANKLYDFVIRDVNPEISDDEARKITVQIICLKTYNLNSLGEHEEYSKRAKDEAYSNARVIVELLNQDEESFESLQAKYNESDDTTWVFGRGEVNPVIEEAAFSLSKDQVSDILEVEDELYIIKCISDFDVEETQLNKVTILGERKTAVFDETYNEYLSSITKILNQSLYDEIVMIHDPEVTTSNFFDVDL